MLKVPKGDPPWAIDDGAVPKRACFSACVRSRDAAGGPGSGRFADPAMHVCTDWAFDDCMWAWEPVAKRKIDDVSFIVGRVY